MTFLRPRIGEENIKAVQTTVGQFRQKQAHVVIEETNILKPRRLVFRKISRNAVHKGLGANETDFRATFRPTGQMFPGAETDFHPKPGFGFVEQTRRLGNRRVLGVEA